MLGATFNIWHHLSDAATTDDLLDLLTTPDLSVVGLQEIVWELEIQKLPQGWTFFQPDSRAARKDPVLWNADVWKYLKHGSVLISDRIENSAGAVAARYANWVLLKHRDSGQQLAFVNCHLNASVEGKPGHSKRIPRNREHHDSLLGLVALSDQLQAEHDCPVLIVGDFNVDYGADKRVRDPRFPYSILTAAKFSCAWELGEQSTRTAKPRRGRCIDQPWGRGVTFTEVDSLNQWSKTDPVESDHLPVVFEFRLSSVSADSGEGELMRFVPYNKWSNEARGATRTSHPIGRTKGITSHWEGPGMGNFPHSRCARKVRSIQRFHRGTRGWADIAYNAVVCPHGYVFEGRGAGTKSAANGNSQTNDDWYAVCYLGGAGDPFTSEGKQGFRDAFDWLTREGNAGPARNGHRDHKPTQCPGPAIYRWLNETDFSTEDDLPTPHELMQHRITNKELDKDVGDALRTVFDLKDAIERLEAKCNGCCCKAEDNA